MSEKGRVETVVDGRTGKTEYHVKETDGWTFVSNNKSWAEEAAKGKREFGKNRVSRF